MIYETRFAQCFLLGVLLFFHDISPTKITDCKFFRNPKGMLPFILGKPDRYDLSMKLYKSVLTECADVDMKELEKDTDSLLIFPGTKWCGRGDKAKNYDHLGVFSETDSCCRQHDNCDDYLVPGQCRHNITNNEKFTRLKCTCDETFRQCLQDVNSLVSNLMGYIFFTILHSDCYENDHPIARCESRRIGFLRIFCSKYKLNKNKPKKWQWFEQDDWSFKLKDFNKNPLA